MQTKAEKSLRYTLQVVVVNLHWLLKPQEWLQQQFNFIQGFFLNPTNQNCHPLSMVFPSSLLMYWSSLLSDSQSDFYPGISSNYP
jgi:hypothetical protein